MNSVTSSNYPVNQTIMIVNIGFMIVNPWRNPVISPMVNSLRPPSPGRGQRQRRSYHPAAAAVGQRHFGAARGAQIFRGRG